MNERKYKIVGNQLVNKATGKAIPENEPVFVFRAADKKALAAIIGYMTCLTLNSAHRKGVSASAIAFEDFARKHPDRMKDPD
jgi:hypothetical protein